MQTESLFQSLIEQTRQIINRAEKLKDYDLPTLTWKINPASWNILECVEHLNLYGDFYLPQIDSKINKTTTHNDLEFRSGFLGDYFAKSMLPKEKLNKMKTFNDKNPLNASLDKSVIDRFINQNFKLLDLINQSRSVSLNKVKIESSISGLLRFKLGDTYRFLINHMIRHFSQIDRIQNQMKNA